MIRIKIGMKWVPIYVLLLTAISAQMLYGSEDKAVQARIVLLEKEISALKEQAVADPFADKEPTPKAVSKKQVPTPAASQDPGELTIVYQRARNLLEQQRLDMAFEHFNDLIEKHDGTPEALLARFWKAEILFYKRNYSQASIAYGEAYGALKKLKADPNFKDVSFQGEDDRMPEILAKLAFSLKMIGKKGDACTALHQLKKEYPKPPENLSWYVSQLATDAKCKK
jgi:TolA-binding protein